MKLCAFDDGCPLLSVGDDSSRLRMLSLLRLGTVTELTFAPFRRSSILTLRLDFHTEFNF